jgi:hypothetical protein
VIGGYAAGVVWLAACISGLEIVRRKPRDHEPPTGVRASALEQTKSKPAAS